MSQERETREQSAAEVGEQVAALIMRLHIERGMPLDLVLSAAHAQVVTMMAAVLGGESAYRRCVHAAELARPMLSLDDVTLAATTPEGRA